MRTSLSSIRIIQRQSFLFIIPLVLILIFAFAACGSNGGTGAGGSTPTTAPTTITGSTPEGCPSSSAPSTSQQKPDVTIQLKDTNNTITAHNGNLIEVRLPFGQQWSGPTASQ